MAVNVDVGRSVVRLFGLASNGTLSYSAGPVPSRRARLLFGPRGLFGIGRRRQLADHSRNFQFNGHKMKLNPTWLRRLPPALAVGFAAVATCRPTMSTSAARRVFEQHAERRAGFVSAAGSDGICGRRCSAISIAPT
jgi:hypothetical protein